MPGQGGVGGWARGGTRAPALCQELESKLSSSRAWGQAPEFECVQGEHAESGSEPPSRFTLGLAKLLGYRKPEGVKAE